MSVPCIAGKILVINLTSGEIEEKPISDAMIEKYLGGRGIAIKMLWDETDKNTDPLGPDNLLIISAGTLTGTFAPCSGRVTVTTKGPATNMICKTSSGGHWGSMLKYAGYDILVIKGAAKKPVYLFIDNGEVSIREAGHLWGKDVRETTKRIREELGDQHIQVACVGQGGENRVLFSALMFTVYHAAGRAGSGAVMGAKRLKAIAVRGTRGLKVANPAKFKEISLKCKGLIMNSPGYQRLSEFGTAGLLADINTIGASGTRNFGGGPFDKIGLLTGQYLKEAGFLKGRIGCDSCVFACHRYTEYKDGFSGGPEYEALSALGVNLGISDTDVVLKANELCNIYGLDVISAGSAIGWAMECFERGVFSEEDTDGITLNWGNGDAVGELITKIALRQGIGDLLAEGVKKASEKVGKDSYKWAVQARGLEQSRVDTRTWKFYALGFALSPRGPDHLLGGSAREFPGSEKAIELVKKLTGNEKSAEPGTMERMVRLVLWNQDYYAVTDALGFCMFALPREGSVAPADTVELFSYATGLDMDEVKLMKAGGRIVTLEQCYNIKLGKTREWHVLPWRLMNEKAPTEAGSMITKEELDGMMDEYFALRQWDKETSFPYLEALKSLDLEEIGDGLNKMGIKLL